MPLTAGTRLGPYEVLAPAGAGGMGEVYKARDGRLARDVALKILPAEVADDAGRRQRFEIEARAVAALNHPNIVAVYDIGAQDGMSYIVMELVDGAPLRGARFGLRTTLDIAVQITSGLAAAHAAGISHRDLKPDNILRTREGRVKILDFGLAKIAGAPQATDSTETMAILTEPGVVLGTVGYMSPEQVRGTAADYRSDIFSFGAILYELLSGTRAFEGETKVETMTAILKHDPPELPDSVPAHIRQMVTHCLEKDPANRFQSARDLSFALSSLALSSVSQGRGSYSGPTPIVPQRSRWLRRTVVALTGLLLLALGSLTGRLLWPTPEPPSWTGGILGGPEMALGPRLSPDGHLLAFQAMDQDLTQVALMKPESGNWSILTHNRERGLIAAITWSVDGAQIYYDRMTDVPQGIYSVPVLGGDERLVIENAASPEALPDGTLLLIKLNAQRKYQLFRFWPENGRIQALPILTSDLNVYNWFRAFPDGKEAAVIGAPLGQEAQGFRLLAVDLATGGSRPLIPPSQKSLRPKVFAVAPDGKSVLAGIPAGSLTRIVSIPSSGRLPARTLFTLTSQVSYLDAGRDGSVYASAADRPAELTRFSPTGEYPEKIGSFPMLYDGIAILPDGRIAVAALASGRDVLMAVEKGKDPVPLVNTTEETSAPMAAAGPREIAFVIGPAPHQTIALAETATGSITHRVSPGKGAIVSLASSPDGKMLYFAAGGSIWSVPASGGESKMIRAGESATMDPSGRSLVVSVMESSRMRLLRVPLQGGAEQEINADGSIPLMTWPLSPSALSTDGRLLLPLQPRDSWFNPPGMLDTATGRLKRLPSDGVSDNHSMAWTRDGQIVALHLGLRSTLWRFQPSRTAF